MIEIQTNDHGRKSFYGSIEVYKYFEPYMDKDVFNETFCWCGGEKRKSWLYLPRAYEFNKRDWKIVVEGFRHFGVDLIAELKTD